MSADFDKVCRTCLVESMESKYLFSVQYINEEQLRLSQILSACTSLQVLENDNLPQQVCVQCEHNILNAFSFQQQCHKSDSVLRAVISESVQTETNLTELKPLEHIEESSLNSSIQFSEILSNSALEEDHSVDDQVDSFVDEVERLNEVIEDQLTAGLILKKDHLQENLCLVSSNKPDGSFDIRYNDSGQTTCPSYSFNIVNQEQELTSNYHIDQEEIRKIKTEAITEAIKAEKQAINAKEQAIKAVKEDTLLSVFACEAKDCCACFSTSQDLRRHYKTHYPIYHYCKICKMTFSSASTLSRHVTSKHQPEKKAHLCSECGKGFARSDDLKRHLRVHTGERPFSCEKCGKAFAQSFRLLEHMRSHSNVKNFICAVCGKAFARYTSLLAHNKTHNKVKSHECKKCGKRLCGPGSLSMHMKIHTGQKDYVCTFCKKSFVSASNLIVHKRTHTGERPYSCVTCGKSFPDNSRLNVHSRIHSGEKPYVCTYCGRGCVSSTQLKRHVRIHTGEKPFACDLCSRSFTRSEDLKNHIKMHKDERNYVCHICQKGFFQRCTLNVHMRIHTGEKPYACNICNKSFSQTGPYSSHMKRHNQTEKHVLQHTEEEKETTVLQYL